MTMTIEEKAKHYDEALERMKSWVRGEHPECFTEAKKAAEFIFPELKESEDEKIRKAILALVRQSSEVLDKQNQNNMIAWLENQAEYKSDEVEPKFKPGDWISGYYTNYKVLSLNNDGYVVEDVDGDKINILFENEKFHHLFTITDAKDGDVLFYSDSASNGIFIFKEIIDKGFAKEVICYCDYVSEDHFCLGEHHTCCWTDAKILHPATKEQRDTLMKAMADAGYIFNFEKKELKKIEESENIKNQIMSEITDLVKDYITQKPAKWSEEDELSCFESALFTAFSDAWQQYLRGKEVDIAQWAKEHSKELLEAAKEELKGHNSAWSKEDEQITLSIEQAMNCASLLNIVPEKMDKIRTWLKSLKDRCTWKPSSLQMECLHDAIKHYHTNGYPASKLKELYEQMSKIYKL